MFMIPILIQARAYVSKYVTWIPSKEATGRLVMMLCGPRVSSKAQIGHILALTQVIAACYKGSHSIFNQYPTKYGYQCL